MGFFSFLGVLSPVHSGLARILSGAKYVGTDTLGNAYYAASPRKGYRRNRRMVKYNGPAEASLVPPEWHGWLHHQTDKVPDESGASHRKPWQKGHTPNMTGTKKAWRPPGHLLSGGVRPKATRDYEAWTPPE